MDEYEDGSVCLSLCTCSTSSKSALSTVNCSGRHLTTVPRNLSFDIDELFLDNNLITIIRNTDLRQCRKLRVLNLSHNNITHMDDTALLSLSDNLQELHLNGNAHLNLDESVAVKIFSQMKSLSALSLHGTNISGSDKFLKNLAMLKTLKIDRKELVTFGESFRSLSNLTSLTLYGRIKVMSNDSFLNLANSSLKHLSVKSDNTLSIIEPDTFSKLSHLETLDLGYNRGIGLRNVSRAWYGLPSTNITTLILSYITADDDNSPRLDQQFYEHLSECQITTLLLDRNNIEEVEAGLNTAFPKLEYFDFSYNMLYHRSEKLVNALYFMRRLQFVDFSGQIKKYLDKRSAQVEYIPETKPVIHERQLIANDNVKNKIETDDMSTCQSGNWTPCTLDDLLFTNTGNQPFRFSPHGSYCIWIPNHLETVNLSASINIRNVKFYQTTFIGNIKNLRTVLYRSNGVSSLIGPILCGTTSAEPLTVDLSYNQASCLSPDLIKMWVTTRNQTIGTINLSNNQLGSQLEHDNLGSVFQYYRYLSVLNLANNNIRSLPFLVFTHLPALNVLNLSGNSLRILEFKMTHFRELKILDLSYNLITNLDVTSRQNLNQLITNNNAIIKFQGNPLECSCDTLPALNWMWESRHNIDDLKYVSCRMNDTFVTFDMLESFILVDLKFSCSKDIILKATGALFGVVILAIVVSIFLYRHRWDIRYFMLQFRRNSNAYIRLVDSSTRFKYDAFVSYHHKDVAWVRDELEKTLEGKEEDRSDNEEELNTVQEMEVAPLRLCIHQRDFDAGESIADNIFTSIEQSKRVILVISRHFLESHWCLFELEIERKQSMVREINIIIPIVLESVELESMPPTLQWLFRTNTYIEWNAHPSERNQFWKRLRRVLAEPFEI